MRSSMVLPFLEQQVHDVEVDFQRLRQSKAARRRRVRPRFANFKPGPFPDGDDVRNRSRAIEYGYGLSRTNCTKVLAQMRFQFGDADLLHVHMMTISVL